MDAEVKQSRLDFIAEVMRKQGLKSNPRRYVVLAKYDRIIDWDRDYTLQFPMIPPHPGVTPGTRYWVAESADTGLIEVEVLSDQLDGLWVRPTAQSNGRSVEFLVHRDELRQSPIPYRELAIRRSQLKFYIGEELAIAWHRNRNARLAQLHV